MSLESISFLAYFAARLSADAIADDNALLIQQGDSIRRVSFAELAEAFLTESGCGAPVTLVADTLLTATHGTVFINPAEGATVLIHLPVYGGVSSRKGYRLKNIGQGIVLVDASDGKSIDNELLQQLAPGDRCVIAKDGTNWQTT